jgi:transcription initiation factor TFIIB
MLDSDEICPNCKAKDSFVNDIRGGEYVCENCGFVASERTIDDTYEKRNFGSDNGGKGADSRVGGQMKAGEGGNLGSNLVKRDKDGNAVRAKSGGGSYNQSPTERNYEEISKILGNQGVSTLIIEETKMIYSQIIKGLNMKGRNFKAVVCAMYYIASKRKNIAKKFTDIANMFGINENKIKRAYNHIKKEVVSGLTIEQQNATFTNYIKDFCNDSINDESVFNVLHKKTYIASFSISKDKNPSNTIF